MVFLEQAKAAQNSLIHFGSLARADFFLLKFHTKGFGRYGKCKQPSFILVNVLRNSSAETSVWCIHILNAWIINFRNISRNIFPRRSPLQYSLRITEPDFWVRGFTWTTWFLRRPQICSRHAGHAYSNLNFTLVNRIVPFVVPPSRTRGAICSMQADVDTNSWLVRALRSDKN